MNFQVYKELAVCYLCVL